MITKDTIRALGVFANSQQIEQAINELKTANFLSYGESFCHC